MSDFLGKKLIAWDEEKGQFEWVSPRISTKTVYNANGQSLDELLAVSPAELVEIVQNIIANAPEEYDTLQEIGKALSENKDSIGTILREISKKINLPDGGSPGQVLKLNADGKVVFGSDENTTYTHPANHSADMITETQSRRFITDQERQNWNGKLNPTDVLSDVKVEVAGQQVRLIDFLETINDFLGTKGQAGGIAELDNAGKVPASQLPPAQSCDLSGYATKSEIPTTLSQLNQDGNNRLVTDVEKTSWNNKVDKEIGKGLSTNDYSDTDKAKLGAFIYLRALTQTQYNALSQAEKDRSDVWYGIYK